jgi:chorismate mutase
MKKTMSSTTGRAARRRTSSRPRSRLTADPPTKGPGVTSPNDDPVIKQFRDQISDNDLKIVDLINKRLTLVDKLWRYKAEHGVDMYNPEREEWMVTFLSRANKGPLSQDALREVYRAIVEMTKNEATRLGAG